MTHIPHLHRLTPPFCAQSTHRARLLLVHPPSARLRSFPPKLIISFALLASTQLLSYLASRRRLPLPHCLPKALAQFVSGHNTHTLDTTACVRRGRARSPPSRPRCQVSSPQLPVARPGGFAPCPRQSRAPPAADVPSRSRPLGGPESVPRAAPRCCPRAAWRRMGWPGEPSPPACQGRLVD